MNQSTTAILKLKGPELLLTRIFWAVATLISFGYFAMLVVNVPHLIEINNARGFVPVTWYDHLAWWLRSDIVHSTLIFFIYTVGATLLFFNRNNELPAVFYSIMYMLLGALPIIANESLKDFYRDLPFWWQLFRAIAFFVVSLVAQIGLYAYPDLRFVRMNPRYLIGGFVFVSGYYALRFWSVGYATADMLVLIVLSLLGGIWGQVDRYRTTNSDTQRQQIKWGAISFASFVFFHAVTIPAFEYIHNPANQIPIEQQFYWFMPLIVLLTIGYMVNLVTFFIAIIRYRLWDVNIIINRSLVYGGLTIVLVGVFTLVFFVLRSVLGVFLSGLDDAIAVASASLLVAMLFSPTRNRLRRFVDHNFFGIEVDYREAMRLYAIQAQSANMPAQSRKSFANYEDLQLVGRGGMGEVYKAHDPKLSIVVAIKTLMQSEPISDELLQRFAREAEAIAHLKHPNIVRLLEHNISEELPYMVMEYIDGGTLNEKLDKVTKFSLKQALPWLRQIASALDYAHEMKIVHRDVKLSNIMIEERNEESRAVLMDFGIARMGAHRTQLTKAGRMMGTLDYISPEQISGASEVDQHADIYSLGVAAFKMITGKLPFEHSNPGALVLAHMLTPPPDPRDYTDLSEQSAFAVLRALSKDPEDRFHTAGAFVDALAGGSVWL